MILIYPHWQSNWVWSAGSLPFLGDDRWVMQPQVSQESSRDAALADTHRSPESFLGQSGQHCWSTTCQVPLAAEITAMSCSSEEVVEQMQEWSSCTPQTTHWPIPNATPFCWAGANKRSEMKRVAHVSVNSVEWNSSDQSKSYLDFLDKWPQRQEGSHMTNKQIICYQKHGSCMYNGWGGIEAKMGWQW